MNNIHFAPASSELRINFALRRYIYYTANWPVDVSKICIKNCNGDGAEFWESLPAEIAKKFAECAEAALREVETVPQLRRGRTDRDEALL